MSARILFSDGERSILLGLLDDVEVDDFTDDEWDALNVIRAKVELA